MSPYGLVEVIRHAVRWALRDEMPARLAAVFEEQRSIRYALYHDPLTGLPNELALRRAQDRQHIGWYVVADLDGFKEYQDSRMSHAAGDEILREFAAWINQNTRRRAGRDKDGSSRGVRLHGDEFVICCTRALGAQAICERVREWRSADGGVTASAGWGRTLAEADQEMYRWKKDKKCASSP